MYYLATGDEKHTRFRNAVIMALVVHAALIVGISFSRTSSSYVARQIEVTLTHQPSTVAPDDARHIAQANQVESGEQADFDEVTRNSLPAVVPAEVPSLPQQRDQQALQHDDVLTTSGMAPHTVRAQPNEEAAKDNNLDGISPEVDRLSRELAGLQAELDEQARSYADQPRVRRLSSTSAKQSADAAYLLDWRRRLEAVGNQYYPEASVRYGIYGDVRLLVVIRQDGSLEDVRILSSSGYAILDEAAIKVVRMAAPYSPFPSELKATTDKLEIIRTWQYLENQLSSKKGLAGRSAAL